MEAVFSDIRLTAPELSAGAAAFPRRAAPHARAQQCWLAFRGGRGADTPCRPQGILGPRAVAAVRMKSPFAPPQLVCGSGR